MSYVIAVYTENAFKEFVLPPIDNADYALILYKSLYFAAFLRTRPVQARSPPPASGAVLPGAHQDTEVQDSMGRI